MFAAITGLNKGMDKPIVTSEDTYNFGPKSAQFFLVFMKNRSNNFLAKLGPIISAVLFFFFLVTEHIAAAWKRERIYIIYNLSYHSYIYIIFIFNIFFLFI